MLFVSEREVVPTFPKIAIRHYPVQINYDIAYIIIQESLQNYFLINAYSSKLFENTIQLFKYFNISLLI